MKRWPRLSLRTSAGMVALAVGVATLCLATGCADLGYLAQSATGHVRLMHSARPVEDWLADPATPQPLKDRLALSQRMRDFAVRELALPENSSYRRYADLGRKAAVWNVAAAPEFALTLHTWCFPFTGCVGYRGYFAEADAQAMAEQLKAQGLEVTVYPVPAYSTLGKLEWLGGDPLLNTFVQRSEADLAQLIFHELSHQVAYAAGDTTFNESYATAVERLGVARWLTQTQGAQAADAHSLRQAQAAQRQREFQALMARWRGELAALYQQNLPPETLRSRKTRVMNDMRLAYEQLKATRWAGFAGYDAFVARANNATLAMQAAYVQLVPAFEALFQQQGQDFPRFHAEVQRLAGLPRPERAAILQALMPPAAPSD